MKIYHLFLLLVVIIPLASAIPDIEVSIIETSPIAIKELSNPATFELLINNKGSEGTFRIFSLLPVDILPSAEFILPKGFSTLEIEAYLSKEYREEFDNRFSFEYQIHNKEKGNFKDSLNVRILKLENVLEISTKPISPEDIQATIIITNKENTIIDDLEIKIESQFFSSSETINLEPFGTSEIKADLSRIQGIIAGPYIVTATITTNINPIIIESAIVYEEKEKTSYLTTKTGKIIKKTNFIKTNDGNTPTTITIETKKDIISRLFTIFSPKPNSIERNNLFVHYSWTNSINPGESFTVLSTTNYTFPFLLLLVIIIIAILVKTYSTKALSLTKKISLVKTKKGEFALKVSLHAKARKHIKSIQIIDRIPAMTKLFEKFGKIPDKIDEEKRRLIWNLTHLAKGEKRVISYIIYSKMNIIGRFELPNALAVYEKNGKVKETLSNKAFFAAEKMD